MSDLRFDINLLSELLKNGLRSNDGEIINATVDLLLLMMNLVEQNNRSEEMCVFERDGMFEGLTNKEM